MDRFQTRTIYSAAIVCGLLAGIPAMAQQNAADLNFKDPAIQTRSVQALREIMGTSNDEYTIGDGDELDVQVVGRPELSGPHLVGPDGKITLPLRGSFEVKNLTREGAAKAIAQAFEKYYTNVDVTLRVMKYGSNRIMVLGNVGKPGIVYFDNAPTLLEALTKSGAAPNRAANDPSMPRRAAIFRGKDLLVWIDLKSMMDRGDSLAELRMKRDDVLYVPDEQDMTVSVLGEVQKPGMVKLQPQSTLLDVLAQSGGLTPDSGKARIEVIRQNSRAREIAFNDLVDPTKNIEFPLVKGDVIYVQKGTMAKVQNTFKNLSPVGTMMLFGAMLGASFQ